MSGWQFVALGDIFGIARGGSPRPIDRFLTDDPDGINWIMIADASGSSKYITKTKKRIKRSGLSRSRFVNPGDFLLTNSMSFGRPYIMKTSGCIHDGWLVLSPQHEDVDQDYFYHLFGSNIVYAEFQRRAAGATVKNLNIDLVKSVKIPLPPLSEQKRIAAILDKAEELRGLRRQALAQLDAMVQSIFLEMFGDPETNSKKWNVLPLSNLVQEFRYGTSNKSQTHGKPTLRIPNVVGGTLDLSDLKVVPVSTDEFEKLRIQNGDFLFVRTNGNPNFVGRCAVFDSCLVADTGFQKDEFIFASYLIRARLALELVEPIFLREFLLGSYGRKQLRSRCKTSAGQFNINIPSLSIILIPLPPLSLQQEFARRVEAIETLKATQRESLAQLDALFASLQDRAFRGEL